jgi:hypothetical protein
MDKKPLRCRIRDKEIIGVALDFHYCPEIPFAGAKFHELSLQRTEEFTLRRGSTEVLPSFNAAQAVLSRNHNTFLHTAQFYGYTHGDSGGNVNSLGGIGRCER